jgi:hypothetical protein
MQLSRFRHVFVQTYPGEAFVFLFIWRYLENRYSYSSGSEPVGMIVVKSARSNRCKQHLG